MGIPSRSDLDQARAEGEAARTAKAAADAKAAAAAAKAKDKADKEQARALADKILGNADKAMSRAAAAGWRFAVLAEFHDHENVEFREYQAPKIRGIAALALDIIRERMAADGYTVRTRENRTPDIGERGGGLDGYFSRGHNYLEIVVDL
jgi:hypothetical protein